jgi:hypothetical protein
MLNINYCSVIAPEKCSKLGKPFPGVRAIIAPLTNPEHWRLYTKLAAYCFCQMFQASSILFKPAYPKTAPFCIFGHRP